MHPIGLPKVRDKSVKRTSYSVGCANPTPPTHKWFGGVLGTRKPLIVNLSVPDVTEKLYRGVRLTSPKQHLDPIKPIKKKFDGGV